MWLAGETACATTGKSFACIGGACFSLPTPACGRIFSQRLTVVGWRKSLMTPTARPANDEDFGSGERFGALA
jgi:hypothetical protein